MTPADLLRAVPLVRRRVGTGVTIAYRIMGEGPLLLLHGAPQSHVMWARVAPRLAPAASPW